MVIDAAHGAAFAAAPRCSQGSARGSSSDCTPNGKKINVHCGSTDLTPLKHAVSEHPGSFGVAFDGDADRALFVDESGVEVTGDHVLALRAIDLAARGELPHRTLVATVMSNIGLEIALREKSIALVRTPVGDRYVLEEMQRGGFRLGGEQSGHIIDLEANATGDGIATAVAVSSLAAAGGGLARIASVMQPRPQVLVNISVKDKSCLELPDVKSSIARTREELGEQGRILVRASGTEPLIRVMIEGQDEREIRALAQQVAEIIRATSQM